MFAYFSLKCDSSYLSNTLWIIYWGFELYRSELSPFQKSFNQIIVFLIILKRRVEEFLVVFGCDIFMRYSNLQLNSTILLILMPWWGKDGNSLARNDRWLTTDVLGTFTGKHFISRGRTISTFYFTRNLNNKTLKPNTFWMHFRFTSFILIPILVSSLHTFCLPTHGDQSFHACA